jgi:hypothetical protein
VRWVRFLPAVGAALVLLVGALVYEWTIPVHHVEQSRLSRLVVTKPPAGFNVKPTSSQVIAASGTPFAAFKTAASRSPHRSGAYAIQWPGTTSSSTDVASVLAIWLPTTSDAAAVEKQAVSADLAATSYQSADGYALERRFTIPAVPGAQAAVYGPQSSKSNQGEGVAVVVFPEGRYVVTDFVQMTSATKAQAEATSLTEAEETQLRQVGPGFTLSVTHLPLEASLIFAGLTVSLAALVVLVPLGVSRARVRQRLAREAASRRAVQGRGRKIARHQAARSR